MTVAARILICLSSGLLLAGGGCSRTSDGSVIIPRQFDARNIWDKGPSPTQTPPVAGGANVFPVVAQPRRFPKTRTQAGTTANESTVACGTAQQSGQRVRVVCQ